MVGIEPLERSFPVKPKRRISDAYPLYACFGKRDPNQGASHAAQFGLTPNLFGDRAVRLSQPRLETIFGLTLVQLILAGKNPGCRRTGDRATFVAAHAVRKNDDQIAADAPGYRADIVFLVRPSTKNPSPSVVRGH